MKAGTPIAGLDRLVPDLALEWYLRLPRQRWRQVEGTLCLADVSGFTALAERLAQRGRAGGEELVESLSAVFAEMLDLAALRGGSLLKFGGDALLLLFEGADHACQAASAAVEMRAALRDVARRKTSVGRLELTMSVGLHSGVVDCFLVGDTHRELILLGPAIDAVIDAERTSAAGQILLTEAARSRLPDPAAAALGRGLYRLRWRRPRAVPLERVPPAPEARRFAAALLPPSLRSHLQAGPPEPEHRVACVAFARFSGTDEVLQREGAEALAARLDDTLGPIQRVLNEEGITLFTVDVDRGGGKLFMSSGVPFGNEDDEGSMLHAMRHLLDLKLPFPLHIGVHRGHVFAAEVGSPRRAAYSAMGDITNTAARIAAATPVGHLYAHPQVLDESRSRFAVTPGGTMTFKGKVHSQAVYSVGAFLGLRPREGLVVDRVLGRKRELRVLSRVLDGAGPADTRLFCVSGAPGIGKSRLLAELAAPPGVTLLRLLGEPYGSTSPYRLWRDPLRALLGLDRDGSVPLDRQLEALVWGRAPEQAPWLALIGTVVHVPMKESPEVGRLDPKFRPERTAAAVLDLCEAVSPGHHVVIMDDAQWADEASIRLLEAVAQRCNEGPWALVVSRRDEAEGFVPAGATALPLAPLSDSDIRQLVELATEAAPLSPEAQQSIVARAAGNPRFAAEFVRSYRDVGSLAALPESLEAALLGQVEGLAPRARRMLRYGAVLGRSFYRDVLAEVVMLVTGESFDDRVFDQLGDYLDGDGDGLLRFRSGVLRDTLYENLSFRLRARLHRAAARALEARSEDPAMVADDLALHCFRGEMFEPAARYARIAADRAWANYANADASRLYAIALEASRRLAHRSAQTEIELQISLGEAHQRAGEFDDALRAYRLALRRVGEEDRERRAELIFRRADVKEQSGSFSAALRDTSIALRILHDLVEPKAAGLRARVESLRAMVLLAQGRPRRALAQARIAADHAREVEETRALVLALNAMEVATLELEGPGDGRHLKEAMRVANRADQTGLKAMAATNLGALYAYAGRWQEGVELMREGRELNLATGNHVQAAYASINLAELLINQHRAGDARALLEEATRVMRGLGAKEGLAAAQVQLARLHLLEGDADRACDQANAAVELLRRLGERHFELEAQLVAAEADHLRGESQAALERLIRAEKRAGGEAAHLQPRVALVRARLLAALGETQGLADLLCSAEASAQAQGLHYELALLRLLREELTPAAAPEQELLVAARRQLEELGVGAPA